MSGPSRFVGRTTELASLRQSLTTPGSAETLTIVTGEAGVGKTRFVQEAIRPFMDDGALIVRGECIVTGSDLIPLAPIVEGIRRIAASASDPGIRERLRSLTQGEPRSRAGATAPSARPAMVLDALVQAAGRRRLILVVDDLQWADQATRGLIEHIVRNVRSTRVSALATLRLDAQTPKAVLRLTGVLVRHRRVRFLDLEPLEDAALREMITEAWGADTAVDVIDRIIGRAGGLPYYVESILAQDDRSARALPDDLRIATIAAVDALPADARRVLEILAILIEPVDRPLLLPIAGFGLSRLHRALLRLARADLAIETEGRWSVRQTIVREVLRRQLTELENRGVHATAALAIRAAAKPDHAAPSAELLAMAARHAHSAGAARDAALDHVAAASAALNAEQAELAAREAMAAVELARRRPDLLKGTSWDIAEVEILAARALSAAGRPGHAERILRALASDVGHSADSAARVAVLRTVILGQLGDVDAAATVAEAAVEAAAEASLSPRWRCRLLNALASCRSLQGRGEEGRILATEALGIAGRIEDQDALVESRSNLGQALAILRDEVGARREFSAAWAAVSATGALLSARSDDVEAAGRVYALANIADFENEIGAYQQALAVAATVRGRGGLDCARRETRECRMLATVSVAALTRLGRWAEAAAQIRAGLRGAEPNLAALLHAYHARILAASGRFRQARLALERARRGLDQGNDPWVALEVHACAGEVAMWEGDQARLRAAVRGAMRIPGTAAAAYAAGLELHAMRLATETDAPSRGSRTGRPSDSTWADVAMREAVAATGGSGRLLPDGLRMTVITWCRAELDRIRGEDDPSSWEQLARGWERLGRPLDRAYALYRLATSHRPGEHVEAADALIEAHDICTRLGARPLAWRIERAASKLGLALGDLRRNDARDAVAIERVIGGLTPREREVAELIARGASNRDIARELVIAEKTASIHVSNIISKLGVGRRGEVAALVHQVRQGGTD